MPADDQRQTEPPETYALARRGLPLPQPVASVLRAPWLPAMLRRRALPVEARVIPLPAINGNGLDEGAQDPNEPELAADFADSGAGVGHTSSASGPTHSESVSNEASPSTASTSEVAAPVPPLSGTHTSEPRPSMPNTYHTAPIADSRSLVDSETQRKPAIVATNTPGRHRSGAEYIVSDRRETSFDGVHTPSRPVAREHAGDMALPVQATPMTTGALLGQETSRSRGDLGVRPPGPCGSAQGLAEVDIATGRQSTAGPDIPTPLPSERVTTTLSIRDDSVIANRSAVARAPMPVMGLPVAVADRVTHASRSDGSAARPAPRPLEAAELAALQAAPAAAARPLRIDRVQVMVQTSSAASPRPQPGPPVAAASPSPSSPRANAPVAYRNPWSSYFARRD